MESRAFPGRDDVVYAISARADGTMSATVGDGDHRLARTRLTAAVGADQAAFMRQVHGATVARVDSADDPAPEADAVLTTRAGLGVAVLVADCVPVVLAAGDAVAAVHAGRLGVEKEVVPAAVEAVRDAAGDDVDVQAVIGPAIGPCCYEVPSDMAAAVDARWPGAASETTWGTPSLDLPGTVAAQLRAAGVALHVDGGCTRCESTTRFSHRASTGPEQLAPGRQAMVVVRRPDEVTSRSAPEGTTP